MLFKDIDLKKTYILYFILTFHFFFNIYQLNFSHWSSMMDHDFYILYNSKEKASINTKKSTKITLL